MRLLRLHKGHDTKLYGGHIISYFWIIAFFISWYNEISYITSLDVDVFTVAIFTVFLWTFFLFDVFTVGVFS